MTLPAHRPEPVLRVLFAFEQYAQGGFESHLDTLIQALASQGVEMSAAGGGGFDASAARPLVGEFRAAEFSGYTCAFAAGFAHQIEALAASRHIGVIHAHPFLSLLPASLGAMLAGVPYVVTFHAIPDSLVWSSYLGGLFVEATGRFVLPGAALITAISEETAAAVECFFDLPPSSVAVLRNPIDFTRFRSAHAPPDRRTLLIASRLDGDKYESVAGALRFAAALRGMHAGWRIQIAGSGQREGDLRALAEQYGLNGIEWLGHQSDMPALIGGASVVAGMDRVILEALATERLAVVSGWDGLVGVAGLENFELLRKLNFGGRGIVPADPADIAHQVSHLLENGGHQTTALRALAEEWHDARHIGAEWVRIYHGLRAKPAAHEAASEVVAWLENAGGASLRSLQWAEATDDWPSALIGVGASAIARQAMTLRAAELGHGAAANAALEERLVEATESTESLRGELGRGAAACAALEERLAEATESAEALRRELGRSVAANAALEERLAEATESAEARRRELARTYAAKHEAERWRAAAERALDRAELARGRLLRLGHQFRTLQETRLAEYRAQRAWKVMLWLRKAYPMWASHSAAGFHRLISFLWRTLRGKDLGLEAGELSFPSLDAHMPQEIMEPFTTRSEPASVVWSGARLSPPTKYDVVILAIIDFEFRFQRPQQLAVRFARHGHRVFWVSPTRFMPPGSELPYEISELRENLWELRLRGEPQDIYGGRLTAGAAGMFLESFEAAFAGCGVVENCIMVQLPFWRQVALGLRERFGSMLVYDCMDDWETFAHIGRFNLSEEDLLARETDLLVVTAERLRAKFEARSLRPLLVRNGADFEFFSSAKAPPPAPAKVAGYFGAIADWMDLDLMYEVARSRPQYRFVLIGEVFDRDVSNLRSLGNVSLTGHKDYRELPECLAEFDACLIPFVKNRVTESTDPVKLYEYFSQGKPVVATRLGELEVCGDLVYLASNAAEFAAKLDAAMAEPDGDLRRRRIAYAAANTWASRVAAIDACVRKSAKLISILIVTHNSGAFIGPCLEFLLRNTAWLRYEVIVADNGSGDDTVETVRRIAQAHPEVRLLPLSRNTGFAAGNNFAWRHAGGDYIVYLNADTLVTAGWLGTLAEHLRCDCSLGLVVPVTNFAGNEVKINFDYEDSSGMEEFAARVRAGARGRSLPIRMAPLYCAMLPRAVIERVGEIDESFGVGMFEDDDYSMRIREAGYSIVAAEDCFVHHFGQGSFGQLDPASYEDLFEENRRRFETKWRVAWQPHTPRPGVRPVQEDVRFDPRTFLRG